MCDSPNTFSVAVPSKTLASVPPNFSNSQIYTKPTFLTFLVAAFFHIFCGKIPAGYYLRDLLKNLLNF
jgi:hypothetical protein